MKKPILLVLSLLIIVSIVSCSKTPQERRKELFAKAVNRIDHSDFEGAAEGFRQLRQEFVTSSDGLLGSGLILEAKMLYHDALGAYLTLLASDPASVKAHEGAGRCYRRLDRLDRAISEYRQAFSLPEASGSVAAGYLSVLIDNWEIDAASELLDSALQRGLDDAQADVIRARITYHRGDPAGADKLATRAREGKPSADLYTMLADYYEDRGMIGQAIEAGRKAVAQKTAGFVQRQSHFLRCLRYEYLWEARQVLGKVRQEDKAGGLLSGMLVHYYHAAHNVYLADSANVAYVQHNPNRLTAVLEEIKTQWMKSDLEMCLGDIDQAKLLVFRNDYVQDYRDFARGEVELVSLIVGDIPGVGEELRQMSGFQNGERPYILKDMLLRRRVNLIDDFTAYSDTLQRRHGSDPVWIAGIADIFADAQVRVYDSAEFYYRQALSLDSGFIPALENWVGMNERRHEYALAGEVLSEFQYLVDRYPPLQIRQAMNAARIGKIERARAIFTRAVPQLSGHLQYYLDFATVLERKGRLSEAAGIIDQAVSDNAGNPDVYYIGARYAGDNGQWGKCEQLADKGLGIEPDNAFLLAQMARRKYAGGDREGAVKDYERLLKEHKGVVDAPLYYSLSLARSKTNERRAENLARRAVFLGANSLRSLLNLSEVYYLFGKYKFARGEGRRASHAYPDSPQAFYHLGRAYFKTNHRDTRKVLQRAIDLGLSGEMLADAKQLLASVQ